MCLFLLYSPPVYMGDPQKITPGLGKEATISIKGPSEMIVSLATPAGLWWVESREGIVAYILVSKGNFVLVYC